MMNKKKIIKPKKNESIVKKRKLSLENSAETSKEKNNNKSKQKQLKFSYIPDPSLYQGGTWREEEILGHNSLAYPCAELIDNSLMATMKNQTRQIDVKIIYRSNDDVFFVVCDNGKGMNFNELQNLAVFAHAPDYDNMKNLILDTNESKEIRYLNSCISKFGVGLKNAAFHIGNNMTVITKSQSSENVLEFNMNIREMKEKYKCVREKAYEGIVTERKPGDVLNSVVDFSKPSKYLEEVIVEETKKPSFTTIIVSGLSTNHVERLSQIKDFRNLAKNLASLYHYYLHGVYGKSANEQEKIFSSAIFNTVSINLNYYHESKSIAEKIPLKDVDDDVQSLKHKYYKGVPFRFELILPHKDPVMGAIYYFPFENEEETVSRFSQKIYRPNYSPSQSATSEETTSFSEKKSVNFKRETGNDTAFDPIFNCFWQGRQIPFSNVSILNFMLGIEPFLRKRIRGDLFFNESFPVNPQKNIFNVDLDEKLNAREAKIINMTDDLNIDEDIKKSSKAAFEARRSKRPRSLVERNLENPSKRFSLWANKMSQLYDKEIEYLDEIDEKHNKFYRSFKNAIYCKKVFKSGDLIKIVEEDSNHHFGRIDRFLVKEGSDGLVQYTRLPFKIYENELFVKPTRNLEKTLTSEELKAQYHDARAEILSEYPDSLNFNFDTKEFDDIEPCPQENVQSGYLFPDCYISILGKGTDKKKKGMPITSIKIKNNKRNIILVVLQILQYFDEEKNEWIIDPVINGSKEHECSPLNQKFHHLGHYYFKPVKLTKLGKCQLIFAVAKKSKTEEKNWIIFQRFNINVSVGLPKTMSVLDSEVKVSLGPYNEFSDILLPVELKDDTDYAIPHLNNMKLVVSFEKEDISQNDDLKISANLKYFKNVKKYCFCDFTIVPDKTMAVGIQGLPLKPTVVVQVNEKITIKDQISFLIMPGIPKSIMAKNSEKIKIENHKFLNKIVFHLLDEYGNITSSSFGVKNLVFKVDMSKKIKIAKTTVLVKVNDFEYELVNMQVDANWTKFEEENDFEEIEVGFEVYAMEKKKSTSVIPFKSSFIVFPSKTVSTMILCRSPEEFNRKLEVPEFNVEVGKINRIFVKFLTEKGDVPKISQKDIEYLSIKVIDEEKSIVKKDEKGNLVIEIYVPEKMDGSRNCFVECALKVNPEHIMRQHFKILPIYGDPVKWDLDFPDTIKNGTKISNFLSIFLIDQYGNRLSVEEFEDPLKSNPIIISSCTFTNMEPDIDLKRGCFIFPQGVINGKVGKHNIEVAENKEYEFKASNQIKFYLDYGYPETIQVQLVKGIDSFKQDEKWWAYTNDIIEFEASLVDSSGNLVSTGNYTVNAEIPFGPKNVLRKQINIRSGVGKEKFLIKIMPELANNFIDAKFHLIEKNTIRTTVSKPLFVKPTPNHVIGLTIPKGPLKTKIDVAPPVIVCDIHLEAKNEEFAGEASSFSLLVIGAASESAFYLPPVLDKNSVVFKPKDRFSNSGKMSMKVVYKEQRITLPSIVESNVLLVDVFPGEPDRLVVINEEQYNGLSATNVAKCRTIIKSIKIGICDALGIPLIIHPTTDQTLPKIKINIVPSFQTNKESIPQITYKSGDFMFSQISIVENTGIAEGLYKLEFSVDFEWKLLNPTSPYCNLKHVFVEFYFSSDTSRVEKQKQLDQRRQEITAEINEIAKKLEPLQGISSKKQELLDLTNRLKLEIPTFVLLNKRDAFEKLEREKSKIASLITRNKTGHSLPVFNDPVTQMRGYIGRVGELISVENFGVARCVMYLLGSRLNTHLTRGENTPAYEQSIKNLKSLNDFSCLDLSLLPNRTFESFLKGGKLPHQGRFDYPNSKAPSYIVHKLHLKPGFALSKDEFEQIFIYFLGNSMIMNNIDHAIEYERACINKKISLSKIVTTDGFHVQLVKHKIPTFELMKKKNRGIAVYPVDMIQKLQMLNEILRPKLEKYYIAKERLLKLMDREKESVEKKAALEKKLKGLQKERMNNLSETKALLEGKKETG